MLIRVGSLHITPSAPPRIWMNNSKLIAPPIVNHLNFELFVSDGLAIGRIWSYWNASHLIILYTAVET